MSEVKELHVAIGPNEFSEVFTDNYANEQIAWYGIDEYKKDAITIISKPLVGRCDHYLHKSFEVGDTVSPVMFIDKELWMSLTPMEIQSAAYAISYAEGIVGTGGLGMGYFALSVAENPDVYQVDVYENNPDVIKYFTSTFSNREGFEKINIIEGDIRDNLKNKTYDLFFNDIYQTMLPDEVIYDIYNFTRDNTISKYLFWGYELAVWSAAVHNILDDKLNITNSDIDFGLTEYFRGFISDEERHGLSKGGWDLPDAEFTEKIVKAMFITHGEMLP